MKKRIFMDMDGVLCRFDPSASPADLEKDGFFRDLAPREMMVQEVRRLMEIQWAEVYILSSVLPGRKQQASAEKNEWLDRYLPDIDRTHRLFPLCGTDKSQAVGQISHRDILCDDHTPNLVNWIRAGGKGIKIINEINGTGGTFKNGPRIFMRRPGELVEAIDRVLK